EEKVSCPFSERFDDQAPEFIHQRLAKSFKLALHRNCPISRLTWMRFTGGWRGQPSECKRRVMRVPQSPPKLISIEVKNNHCFYISPRIATFSLSLIMPSSPIRFK